MGPLANQRHEPFAQELLGERGRPKTIVSENGTELTSNAILGWADDHKVARHYLASGKPVEIGEQVTGSPRPAYTGGKKMGTHYFFMQCRMK
jgi:hypothetical protein